MVVTGYYRSCGEVLISGQWFANDVEKIVDQKDTISYLSAGGEETYGFQEIAFYYGKGMEKRINCPITLKSLLSHLKR